MNPVLLYWLKMPDEDIYRLALDIAQVPAEQVVYIDDHPICLSGSPFASFIRTRNG